MMNESIDKIMPVLEKLAKEFNTTTDYLWEIMVRQAMVVFVTDLVLYVLGIIICIIGIKITFVLYKRAISILKKKKEGKIKEKWEFAGDDILDSSYGIAFLVSLTITLFVSLFTIIVILYSLTNTMTALINPEYWALEKLFSVFRSI